VVTLSVVTLPIRDVPFIASRRSFLKAGLIATIALATAGGVYRAARKSRPAEPFILDGAAKSALAAIVAVMLKDALPAAPQATEAAITRVQGAIAGLPVRTQSEVQDLFALLALGPARRWLAGVPTQWNQADPADVAAFLQSWRLHRLGLLQNAYFALHDLILGAWYADESTWASIGYPGPMKTSG
jgi:hypothetical protein